MTAYIHAWLRKREEVMSRHVAQFGQPVREAMIGVIGEARRIGFEAVLLPFSRKATRTTYGQQTILASEKSGRPLSHTSQ